MGYVTVRAGGVHSAPQAIIMVIGVQKFIEQRFVSVSLERVGAVAVGTGPRGVEADNLSQLFVRVAVGQFREGVAGARNGKVAEGPGPEGGGQREVPRLGIPLLDLFLFCVVLLSLLSLLLLSLLLLSSFRFVFLLVPVFGVELRLLLLRLLSQALLLLWLLVLERLLTLFVQEIFFLRF